MGGLPSAARWLILVVASPCLLAAACGTASLSPPAEQPSVTAMSQTATPAPSPSRSSAVSSSELIAVAKSVMAPAGTLCDTHRDTAPSDVNACPYTARLRTAINARYQQAWSGHANPNPVLSSGPPCGPPGSTVVSYFPSPDAAGGTVSLVATCGGPTADASASWQKLVIVSANGSLLVDVTLLDLSHTRSFVSVYG